MSKLLLNRNFLSIGSLIRKFSLKPIPPPLKCTVKGPPMIVYKPIIYQFSGKILKQINRSNSSYASINIDATKLTKDVIVFKYDNPKHFKIMNIFGIAQFFFWLMCSEFTLSQMRYTPINTGDPNFADLPFYLKINLGENKYKYALAIGSFAVGMITIKSRHPFTLKMNDLIFDISGFGILAFVWTFTLRNVRYLVMRKGGATVSFVTYGPFGTNRITDVPLRFVSAVQSRDIGASALPIKVRGKRFHYILDKQGEYTNPQLFDHVINVKRRI